MPVINRDLVSHHANSLLRLLDNDETSPLTPVGDVTMMTTREVWAPDDALDARFRALDSDGVAWVISVRPAAAQTIRKP